MTNSNQKIEEATVDLVGNKYAAKTIAEYLNLKNLQKVYTTGKKTTKY